MTYTARKSPEIMLIRAFFYAVAARKIYSFAVPPREWFT
jgi:hypothetical protein